MKPYFSFFILTFTFTFIFIFIMMAQAVAQNNGQKDSANDLGLPYYQIPAYPETYTSGNVAARMVDALGFRYYWATEGLREEDLKFRPNEGARTSMETLDHIYDLSMMIVNATAQKANGPRQDDKGLTFEQLREKTLQNFKKASDLLKAGKDNDMESFRIFSDGDEKNPGFPFWNVLNGPIADAIWHVGQVVSFRRSSGNPFNSKVSVFQGKLRD